MPEGPVDGDDEPTTGVRRIGFAADQTLELADVSGLGGGSQEVADERAGFGKSLEVGGIRILVEGGQDERAVKDAEDAEWKRTDPEARERAQDTVDMFTAQIEKLEKQAAEAEAAGHQKKLREARNSIAACQAWLDQAKATLAEFSA